ncbi:MAG: ARMT1-like domain-containing protein [Thermodesulfobacteriota bacterium]|nr:ARMT1-like domain-containing protein [Thermodesulfobacteriota bacterium]
MRTSLDCLPCFLRQALNGARLAAPDDPGMHRRVVLAWAKAFSSLDLDESPPALAGILYAMLSQITGCADPYAAYKAKANMHALTLAPDLERVVRKSLDPLRAALGVSIIGNYMDPAAPLERDLERALKQEEHEALDAGAYEKFKALACAGRARALILGDNAGEIALDTLLVRELLNHGCEVIFAVRDRPVINDATLEDAHRVGMTKLCRVVSSGADTPGTVLSRCSKAFLEEMDRADVIVAKGQGNFEALRHRRSGVFHAFKVKCPVVAEDLGVPQGRTMFLYD